MFLQIVYRILLTHIIHFLQVDGGTWLQWGDVLWREKYYPLHKKFLSKKKCFIKFYIYDSLRIPQ